jgi:hypothetical protein
MKKKSLILFGLILSILIFIGCNKTDESYLASADSYTYDESDRVLIFRYLYKDDPVLLDEGSSLYYYIEGADFKANEKPLKERDYSEYYVIIQPSIKISLSDGPTKNHKINVEKEEFASFVSAVKNLRHLEGKERALRETFLTVLKDKSWVWQVDPAAKEVKARIGFDSNDLLTSKASTFDFIETEIRYLPFSLTLHYDLFTDDLTVDTYVSYSGDQYHNVQKINISSDFERFTYTDLQKSENKIDEVFVGQVLLEHFDSIDDSLRKGQLPLSFDSDNVYISFLGPEDEQIIEPSINTGDRQRFLLDSLAAISTIHDEMLEGSIDPQLLNYVLSLFWRFNSAFVVGFLN